MSDVKITLTEALEIRTTTTTTQHESTHETTIMDRNGRRVTAHTVVIPAVPSEYTPIKALIVAWLEMGIYTPIGARTENLSDHKLSTVGFMVTPDAVLIAGAYKELTGLDITEAI